MNKQRDKIPVHPTAEIFPMLPDDELQSAGEARPEFGISQMAKLHNIGMIGIAVNCGRANASRPATLVCK
jgi:hypothetical protein